MAGVVGIEPTVWVLETHGLPLTDTPKNRTDFTLKLRLIQLKNTKKLAKPSFFDKIPKLILIYFYLKKNQNGKKR